MSLSKSFNIESSEVTPVLLLIIQSVFLGIFYGAFDIGAHTLFLKTFPEDMIPKAYIISGIVGIMLTAIFSKLQSKISFSSLARYSLLFIAVITALMRLSFYFTDASWTVMVVFILFGPLNIIGILAFWGTVGRIFNLRQGKRLFGIIDAGQIFGIILSSYIIPLILVYLNGINNLLIISAVSAVFAMGIEIVITNKYPIDQDDADDVGEDEKKDKHDQLKLKEFLKQPYILYMALFVAFSMFAAFFVQYSFLVVTNEKYPLEEDMAKFLGFFTGTMMVFTFVIKTFVYSKLIKTYGLKISLILSSVLLALFTAIAIGSGFITGYEAHSSGFIYFFLFISLGKLFNKTLKDALELPSFKLLYQALNKKIRFDVQAKIDGTVNEIAALISGVLLSILGLLAFVKLIHFSIVLFVLLVIWAFITLRLYKEYKNSLEQALKAKDTDDLSDIKTLSFQNNAKLFSGSQMHMNFRNASKYLPYNYTNLLSAHGSNIKDDIVNIGIDLFTDMYFLELAKNSKKDLSDYFNFEAKEFTLKELTLAFNGGEKKARIQAIDYIGRLSSNNRFTILSALLRTPSVSAQSVAIKLCAFHNEIEACPTLVEFVDSEDLMSNAIQTITAIAPVGYKQLIQVYFRSDISLNAQLVIVDALGKVNKPEVISFLLDNLSKHNVLLINLSIQSLRNLAYQADEKTLPRLFPPLTQIANYIAWDIAIISSLEQKTDNDLLQRAMQLELRWHQKMLFDFLKICYSSKSVEHVHSYIESQSSEGIGYGLELFDMILSEEVKPIILTLFDDINNEEKTRQLESFFAVESTSYENVILNIINRDPNLISKRTKKIALSQYTAVFSDILEDIIAQLFSSVEDVQLLAAKSIIDIDQNKFKQFCQRIEVKNRKKLDNNLKIEENITLSSKDRDNLLDNFISKLKGDTTYFNRIFSSIEIEIVGWNKNTSMIDQINNYFVFLVFDQKKSNDYLAINEPIYNFENKFTLQDFNAKENDLIIGIKTNKMNELAIRDKEFVQNLLNIS